MESTEENRVWHDGPPPHVGWWNASPFEYERTWSWWNGTCWSKFSMSNMDESYAAEQARTRSDSDQDSIKWNDYWPALARVPRVDPDAPVIQQPRTILHDILDLI